MGGAANPWDGFATDSNVTALDRLLSPLHPLTVLLGRTGLANLARYRRAYTNYLTVALARTGLRGYPIEGRRRSGGTVRLEKHRTAQLYASEQLECLPEADTVRARVEGRTVTLEGGYTRGDVHGVYVEGVYDWLPVRGRDVLDIGASLGDSSLYFAARGAKRVIGLEPWPSLFPMFVRNVEVNQLESVVLPRNAAIGARAGTIRLDDREYWARRGQIEGAAGGVPVPVESLQDLVGRYELQDAVLKLDCEGGEYAAVLGSDLDVLRRFSHIHIEYHYGYRNLARRLREAGFEVRVDRPFRIVNPASTRPVFRMGNLYASRAGPLR